MGVKMSKINNKLVYINIIFALVLVFSAQAFSDDIIGLEIIEGNYPGYDIQSIERCPIIFGETVKWNITLFSKDDTINFIHETPAISMEITEANDETYWFKNVTLKTNFSHGYKNVTFAVILPLLDDPRVSSEVEYSIESSDEMTFTIPALEDKRVVAFKGLKKEEKQISTNKMKYKVPLLLF